MPVISTAVPLLPSTARSSLPTQSLFILNVQLEDGAARSANHAHKAEKAISQLWREFEEACFPPGTTAGSGHREKGCGSLASAGAGEDVASREEPRQPSDLLRHRRRSGLREEEELRVAVALPGAGDGTGGTNSGAGGGGTDRDRRRRVGGGRVAKGAATSGPCDDGSERSERQDRGSGEGVRGTASNTRKPWVD